MNLRALRTYAALGCALSFLSCGGSGSGGNSADTSAKTAPPENRVAWESVSREMSKAVDDVPFQTQGFERVAVDAFGFKDDVEVVYSPEITAGNGLVRVYKVWANTASFGELRAQPNATTLELKSYGMYQCAITVKNGTITQLDGGCIVRIQVLLPPEAPIEVSVGGKRLTRRFVPVSAKELLKQVDDAVWSAEKLKAVDGYLASYTETQRQPALNTIQLAAILDQFIRSDEKIEVLTKLHTSLVDRQNLGKVIDDKFPSFERARARQIVGL